MECGIRDVEPVNGSVGPVVGRGALRGVVGLKGSEREQQDGIDKKVAEERKRFSVFRLQEIRLSDRILGPTLILCLACRCLLFIQWQSAEEGTK